MTPIEQLDALMAQARECAVTRARAEDVRFIYACKEVLPAIAAEYRRMVEACNKYRRSALEALDLVPEDSLGAIGRISDDINAADALRAVRGEKP